MSAPSPFRILTADRLLDGTGAPPIGDAAILLEGTAIRAIGRRTEVRAPDGATAPVTDYGDATLLPGLVDGHTHLVAPGDATRGDVIGAEDESFLLLRAAANAAAALRSGVTTLRENGAKGRVAFDLRDAILRGVLPGPRMLVCGRPVTITGGHLHFFGGEADGLDGVRQVVRGLVKEGADFIKIVASGGSTRSSHIWRPAFTPPELAAIVDEAHRGERLTGAHAVPNDAISDVLDAGIDMVIHCSMFEADGTYRYRPDLAERIVATGTWVNPTMHDIRAWIHWERDLVAAGGSLTPDERAGFEQTLRFWDAKLDTVSRLRALGAKMMAGSDSPWGRSLPGRGWREIEAFTEAGYTNAEAIVLGTSAAAESIGAGSVAGTLATGRPADILVVPGDPLADLGVLGRPRDVWQAGARVPQEA
ncbi:MAG: amidohydrolase family protein [Chloroflexota bacterium]